MDYDETEDLLKDRLRIERQEARDLMERARSGEEFEVKGPGGARFSVKWDSENKYSVKRGSQAISSEKSMKILKSLKKEMK